MTTTDLTAKYMAIVLTPEGFIKWAAGKPLDITDVKPECRKATGHNFLARREP